MAQKYLPNIKYLADWAYTIDNKTKLNQSANMGVFTKGVGLEGMSTTAKKQLHRNLMPHAEIYELVLKDRTRFSDFKLRVAEGVYVKGANETLTSGGTLDLAQTGRSIVYELLGKDGKINQDKTLEVAEFITIFHNHHDKITLDYDTYNPDGSSNAQIIIDVPTIPESYNVRFIKEYETKFNNKVLAKEFVRIGKEGKIIERSDADTEGLLIWRPGVDQAVNPLIISQVAEVARQFGRPLTVTSGYRDPQRNKDAKGAKGSQHIQRNALDISGAGLSNQDRLQLVALASKIGVTGIGIYNGGSLHFDCRNSGRAVWGSTFSRDSVPSYAEVTAQNHVSGAFAAGIA